MINKVEPVYNPINYYHKWRNYAHTCLNRHTHDVDIHGNLDGDLWKLFNNVVERNNNDETIMQYIKTSIKRLVKRLVIYRLSSKYSKYSMPIDIKDCTKVIDESGDTENAAHKLDITIDSYLNARLIKNYIQLLPKDWQVILNMYYGLSPYRSATLKEISEVLNTSWQDVAQKKNRALNRLRNYLNNNSNFKLEDYINE